MTLERSAGPEVRRRAAAAPGEGGRHAEVGLDGGLLDGGDEARPGRDHEHDDAAAAAAGTASAPRVRHAQGADGAAEGQGEGESTFPSLPYMDFALNEGP